MNRSLSGPSFRSRHKIIGCLVLWSAYQLLFTVMNSLHGAIVKDARLLIAIILTGDARTLLCHSASESFNQAILHPLMDTAIYSVHIFANIKPTVYYGPTSPWAHVNPKCTTDLDTAFMNISKSVVPDIFIRDAVSLMSADSLKLCIVDNTTAENSWVSTLEEKAESVGCTDMLQKFGKNANTTRFILNGYLHFSQWKTVHHGYSMMERAEEQVGKRFDYVMRLRPDTQPLFSSIVNWQHRLPLFDNATVTHFGDGQAIMSRECSDPYFNAYQIYENFCESHLKINHGQYTWGGNTDSYYQMLIHEKGVGLASSKNFTFWFRRPYKCDQLCKESNKV